jgi:hypothetical protein
VVDGNDVRPTGSQSQKNAKKKWLSNSLHPHKMAAF